jgi:nitroimidazol reductase NimA-like FMN-containing flavoprotein (pyridoxamine 5'-phosphate oxidase superfamily)
MCFGRVKLLDDDAEKQAIFQEMTSRYFSGRTVGRDYAAAPKAHLDATPVLEIVIETMSAKMREGGPKGPNDNDDHALGTCGVLPL